MKKIFTIGMAVFILIASAVFACAAEKNANLVVDHADLLTAEQEIKLSQELQAIGEEYEVDVVVLTVASFNGKSAESYADDYFEYNGYGQGKDRDGMILVYKPGAAGDREIALSTSGSLVDCVSEKDSDAMIDTLIPDLVNEDYAAAFNSFVLFAQAEAEETQVQIGKLLLYIPVCLLIGFVLAFIIMKLSTASLKSVRKERTARYYIRQGSLILTGSRDRFLYKNVTKTARQTSSNGTSGNANRVSSSGVSHGGTSRKF